MLIHLNNQPEIFGSFLLIEKKRERGRLCIRQPEATPPLSATLSFHGDGQVNGVSGVFSWELLVQMFGMMTSQPISRCRSTSMTSHRRCGLAGPILQTHQNSCQPMKLDHLGPKQNKLTSDWLKLSDQSGVLHAGS